NLMIDRTRLDASAPAVRHCPSRLEQKQAPARLLEIDAPAVLVANYVEMVLVGVEAEHRQLEPPLAVLAGMAGAGVAPRLGDNGHDLVVVTDSGSACHAGDRDRDSMGGAGRLYRHGCGAVATGEHFTG